MKRWFFLMIAVIIPLIGLGFNFGGGGLVIGYLPPDQINLPHESLKITEGIFLIGGNGFGRVEYEEGPVRIFMGGGGYSGEASKLINGVKYTYVIGGGEYMVYARIWMGIADLALGIGAGGTTEVVARDINSGKTIDDFLNGSSKGCISISRQSYTLTGSVGVHFLFGDFAEVFARCTGYLAFSPEGWKLEGTDELVQGTENKAFRYGYYLSAGVLMGH